MTGCLTTHVLDTARGCPAAGIPIELWTEGARAALLRNAVTNADGRCDAPLLEEPDLKAGLYRLVFRVGTYFEPLVLGAADPPFLDEIVVAFGVADPARHHHVPLLVSPFGYTTYRGS
jgi:5-hydroxyisourate hydrolase